MLPSFNPTQSRALVLLLSLFLCVSFAFAQSATLTVLRKRPPQLNIAGYEKIAIGDIVGSTGRKTERSLDLTDALTSKLFNAKAQEIIDRNALETIFSSQKQGLTAINETSVTALSKKLSSAIMIIGRIQNEKIYSESKSVQNIISSNGCAYSYWYELTGDITVQIKIIDIKTGKLLFSNPVVKNIAVTTKRECTSFKLGDTEPLMQNAAKDLATEITKLIVPYSEEIVLVFERPVLSILKNPFKQLAAAMQNLADGYYSVGLDILKKYADDASLKPNIKAMATYNYGVGLFAAEQYALAEEQFKLASSLGSLNASAMLSKVAAEKEFKAKLATSK